MKKRFFRALALILTLALLCPTAQAAATDEMSETETYRAGVMERYEKHISGDAPVSNLLNSRSFTHCKWADDIESRGAVQKGFLWATEVLLGKKLDTEAYIKYLTNILAMQEQGFVDTLAAQSGYTAKENKLQQLVDLGTSALDAVVDAKPIEKADGVLGKIGAGFKLSDTLQSVRTTSKNAALLMIFYERYAQQLTVLEGIRDNTENETLQEAADALIGTAALEFSYLVEEYVPSAVGGVLDVGMLLSMGGTVEDLLKDSAKSLIDHFPQWAEKRLSGKADKAARLVLKGAGFLVDGLSCVKVGFDIGSGVMKLFVADDVELFREMAAMDAVGKALRSAVTASMVKAGKKDPATAYEGIKETVAFGELLCYARLRGEYCAFESVRGTGKLTDREIDAAYKLQADYIGRTYASLATVFPPDIGQVIVTAKKEQTEGELYDTMIAWPTVYIPDNPKAAEKINANPEFSEMLENGRETAASIPDYTIPKYSVYAGYTLEPGAVYAVAGALSITMSNITNLGGTHPMHGMSTFIFDTKTGELLGVRDLLNPENSAAESELRKLVAGQFDDDFLFETPEKLADMAFDSANVRLWSLAPEGLKVTFWPATVMPYAAGFVTATVPYSDLKGVLKDEYLPKNRTGFIASATPYVSAAAEAGSRQNQYGTPSGYALVADQDALDVCFGDGVDYGSGALQDSVLFYANVMTAADCFWLEETDENLFVLEYTLQSELEMTGSINAEAVTIQNGEVLEEVISVTP